MDRRHGKGWTEEHLKGWGRHGKGWIEEHLKGWETREGLGGRAPEGLGEGTGRAGAKSAAGQGRHLKGWSEEHLKRRAKNTEWRTKVPPFTGFDDKILALDAA